MKRIWFTQQKPLGYAPLRAGLGLIPEGELSKILCKKIYTTRTHRLSGEYIVVEGSRFKAKPVEPEIRFMVKERYQLHLGLRMIRSDVIFGDPGWRHTTLLDKDGLTFPELDLGIKKATFENLRGELLRLNKKATIETPFYVNLIELII